MLGTRRLNLPPSLRLNDDGEISFVVFCDSLALLADCSETSTPQVSIPRRARRNANARLKRKLEEAEELDVIDPLRARCRESLLSSRSVEDESLFVIVDGIADLRLFRACNRLFIDCFRLSNSGVEGAELHFKGGFESADTDFVE